MMNPILPIETSTEIADLKPTIAVLPVGSFEQHGAFLPLSTDSLIATIIAQEIANAYNLFLLPVMPIGCSHEHAGWAGTVSISSATLSAVVKDVGASLKASGIERLLIVNGHGGNYVLAHVAQEASVEGAGVALFPASADWKAARIAAQLVTDAHEDMHAGELEVSILLHSLPAVVGSGYKTADHEASDRAQMLSLGLRRYTESGVVGRPSLGSAEKGEVVLQCLTERASDHLKALGG